MSAAQVTSSGIVPATDRAAELVETAVATLTELARVRYPSPDGGGGRRVDFADLIAGMLSSVAANVDGVEALLAGRPGSWEADLVHQLVAGTVGWDGEYLPEHRTEPIGVDLDVESLLYDRTDGAWDKAWEAAWDRATEAADALYDDALELHEGEDWIVPPERASLSVLHADTPEKVEAGRQAWEAIQAERDKVYRLYPEVVTAYATADAVLAARDTAEAGYQAALLAAAAAKAAALGYSVPVVVVNEYDPDSWLGEELRTHALNVVPVPLPPGTDWAPNPHLIPAATPVRAGDEATEGDR